MPQQDQDNRYSVEPPPPSSDDLITQLLGANRYAVETPGQPASQPIKQPPANLNIPTGPNNQPMVMLPSGHWVPRGEQPRAETGPATGISAQGWVDKLEDYRQRLIQTFGIGRQGGMEPYLGATAAEERFQKEHPIQAAIRNNLGAMAVAPFTPNALLGSIPEGVLTSAGGTSELFGGPRPGDTRDWYQRKAGALGNIAGGAVEAVSEPLALLSPAMPKQALLLPAYSGATELSQQVSNKMGIPQEYSDMVVNGIFSGMMAHGVYSEKVAIAKTKAEVNNRMDNYNKQLSLLNTLPPERQSAFASKMVSDFMKGPEHPESGHPALTSAEKAYAISLIDKHLQDASARGDHQAYMDGLQALAGVTGGQYARPTASEVAQHLHPGEGQPPTGPEPAARAEAGPAAEAQKLGEENLRATERAAGGEGATPAAAVPGAVQETEGGVSPEYPGVEAARTTGGKLGMGADIGRLTEILGSSMYSNRGAPVVVKELLQNAFDAVRQNGGGVWTNLNRSTRTFTIQDTGIGMTPEQVFTVFTDIGASGKGLEAGASGGFGLAKIAPFMIPDFMDVKTTAADPASGLLKTTTFTSTPADIVAGNVQPQIRNATETEGTGTYINVHFAEPGKDKEDTANFYEAENFLSKMLNSVKLPTKEIKFTSGHTKFEMDPFTSMGVTPAFTLRGPGGDYTFHTSEKKEGDSSWRNYEVHNNGLYQFNNEFTVPVGVPTPARMAVDIQANVPEGHADYPFTTNREQLNGKAADFIKDTIQDRFVAAEAKAMADLMRQKYNNMPEVTLGNGILMPIYDSGAKLNSGELSILQNSPAFKDISNAIYSVAINTQNLLNNLPARLFGGPGDRQMGSTVHRIGLLLAERESASGSKRTYGVYIPDPAATQNKASIFISPFGWASLAKEGPKEAPHEPNLQELAQFRKDFYSANGYPATIQDIQSWKRDMSTIGNVDPLFMTPDFAASSIYHTIMHEFLHDTIKGHNENFSTGLLNMDSFLGINHRIGSMEDLANAFRHPDDSSKLRDDLAQLLQIYRDSRGRPANEKDILGGEGLADWGKQPPGEGENRPAEGLRRGGEADMGERPLSAGGGEAGQPGREGKAEKIESQQIKEGATKEAWKKEQFDYELNRLKDILRNPSATPEERSIAQSQMDNLYEVMGKQPLSDLQAILPTFNREVAGETTGAAAPPEPREGGEGGRPPVISDAADENLAAGGINVVERGKDIGIIARSLGSLQESARLLEHQGHPLGPILYTMAGRISDTTKAIANRQIDTMREWVQGAKSKVNDSEWENQVVPLLDNPAYSIGNLPPGTPPHVEQAYNTVRNMLDARRIAMRDMKRRELVLGNGFTPQQAAQFIPDDWGIQNGYYHHAFPGEWTVTYLTGVDAHGNETYEPITTGWRAESRWQALQKAEDHLRNNPGAQVKVEQDTVTLPGKSLSDLQRLRDINNEVRIASRVISQGGDPEQAIASLYNESGKAAWGPRNPAKRQFGAALERESNLPGWAKDKENFERFLLATDRYLEMAPARQVLMKARNSIAELAGMGKIQRYAELPQMTAYSNAKQYGNILARVDSALEGLEGHPGMWDAGVRKLMNDMGVNPNLPNAIFRPTQQLVAFAKLGMNPVRVLSHGLQTMWAVYPVLGEKSTLEGIAHAFNPKYDDLIKDLNVLHSTNSTDLDSLHTYIGNYFGRGSNPIDWTKGAASLTRDLGMLPFTFGIDFTRRVAAVGAYIQATDRGLSPAEARNYARNVLDRTTGQYNPADNPALFRHLPSTAVQFKAFATKTMQFIYGLRGAEIPRFLAAIGALGFTSFPAIRTVFNMLGQPGQEAENYLKRQFPVASRGVFGMAGVDIPSGVGLGDLSITRENTPLAGLAGPLASDIYSVGSAAINKAIQPYSRENQQKLDDSLRNLSPELRRLYDQGVRMAGKEPNLIDPHSGSVILRNLSPKEQVEQTLGLTPLRVAHERDIHEYLRNQIAQHKDVRGYFVDQLAEMQLELANPKLSDDDRADVLKQIVNLARTAQDYGVAQGLPKAVVQRAKDMQRERLERDIKKAPKPLRPGMAQEEQRYQVEYPEQ